MKWNPIVNCRTDPCNALLYQDPNGQDLFSEASALLNGALSEMENYSPGSAQWMNIYAQTQRSLYPMLLAGAMVYSNPWTILKGICTGTTTLAESWAVSRGATAVAVGGSVLTAASIGVVVGYIAGELVGAVIADANFQAQAFVDYWASPDTVMNN